MSADTNVLSRSVAEVENLEGSEEELVAEDLPIRDCLPGLSFCFLSGNSSSMLAST
jgi:hypothetical protein